MYMQRILLFLSDVIIPLFIVVILMAGLLNRRNAYEDFVKGARDGLNNGGGYFTHPCRSDGCCRHSARFRSA